MTWHTTTVPSEELIALLTLIRGQGGTVTCSRPQSDGVAVTWTTAEPDHVQAELLPKNH